AAPAGAARHLWNTNHDHQLAPHFPCPPRRPDRGTGYRADRAARDARHPAGRRRTLCRPLPEAAAGRGTRSCRPRRPGLMSTHFQEDEILGKAYDARLMRRLLRYLRPYRRAVTASIVLLLLA